MKQTIIGFHEDDDGHWVADLVCGHKQHVRHVPPWVNRRWVTSPEGRARHVGTKLNCKQCDREGSSRD